MVLTYPWCHVSASALSIATRIQLNPIIIGFIYDIILIPASPSSYVFFTVSIIPTQKNICFMYLYCGYQTLNYFPHLCCHRSSGLVFSTKITYQLSFISTSCIILKYRKQQSSQHWWYFIHKIIQGLQPKLTLITRYLFDISDVGSKRFLKLE